MENPVIQYRYTVLLYSIIEYPSVPHWLPQFNSSVQHKDHTFSVPRMSQFNTKNRSVQHPPQFHTPSVQHTPQFNTINPSFQHTHVLNWGGCRTEGCVELRGFRYWTEVVFVFNGGMLWTEGFLVLNRGILEAEKEWLFVLNWCDELKGCGTVGDPYNLIYFSCLNSL